MQVYLDSHGCEMKRLHHGKIKMIQIEQSMLAYVAKLLSISMQLITFGNHSELTKKLEEGLKFLPLSQLHCHVGKPTLTHSTISH